MTIALIAGLARIFWRMLESRRLRAKARKSDPAAGARG